MGLGWFVQRSGHFWLGYTFIGFVAMDVTKPYKSIGFGAMDDAKPYKFIGFGAMDGPCQLSRMPFPPVPRSDRGGPRVPSTSRPRPGCPKPLGGLWEEIPHFEGSEMGHFWGLGGPGGPRSDRGGPRGPSTFD